EIINQKQSTPTTSEAAAVERPEYVQRQTFTQLLRGDLGFIPVLLTLLVIVTYFWITTDGIFLKPDNISNLLLQIVNVAIDGVAVTLVLLLGEIDLSVASVGTFAAVVLGVLLEHVTLPPWLAVVVGSPSGSVPVWLAILIGLLA